MNSSQIHQSLNHLPGFIGVYASDQLSSIKKIDNFSLVVNTDPSHLSGRHWVAIVVRDSTCHVFCSLAEEPCTGNIVSFCRRFQRCFYNATASQSPRENTCAAFAIFVICEMSQGVSFTEVVTHFHRICDDDSYVRGYLNRRFGVSIPWNG